MRQESLTNMSSTRPARKAIEKGHGDENPSKPIPNAPAAGSLSAADLMALYDRVQEQVARLDEGTKASNDAIVNLSKVFHEQAHMIKTVGERWDRDQNLEEEIRNLTIANKEMWRHRNTEDEEQKTRMAKLKDDAKAGKEEKQKYEQLATKLKDDYRQEQQTVERELEEARKQDRQEVEQMKKCLEKNMADTIAALQKEKADLTVTTTGLQQELREKQKEQEMERENNKRIQESLSGDVKAWKSKYDEIVAKYAAEELPNHYL
jgi:DNA repair exonuclease SbcCD ATPase subunit